MIVKKSNFWVATIFILTACAPEGPEATKKRPKGILSADSMIIVMTDVHLVEGAKVGRKVIGDSLHKVESYYHKVWDKHGLSSEEYDRNFKYYSRHPDQMNEIYKQVIENLSKMEGPNRSDVDKK